MKKDTFRLQRTGTDAYLMCCTSIVGFRLLQEEQKSFIGVNLFDCFRSLAKFDVQARVSFFITPREEDFQSASVTVDGTCGQTFFTHLQNGDFFFTKK